MKLNLMCACVCEFLCEREKEKRERERYFLVWHFCASQPFDAHSMRRHEENERMDTIV